LKEFPVADDKGFPMGQPSNAVRVPIIGQELHQPLREYFGTAAVIVVVQVAYVVITTTLWVLFVNDGGDWYIASSSGHGHTV